MNDKPDRRAYWRANLPAWIIAGAGDPHEIDA